MALISTKEKRAVGLFVDGLDLKYVSLERTKGGVQLRDFKTVRLVTKLDETRFESDLDNLSFGTTETTSFDLDTDTGGGPDLGEPEAGPALSNERVITNLLADLGDEGYAVSYAVTEPAIDYQILETDFGLQGKKLKERVLEELGNMRSVVPDPDAVSILETGTGSLICIIREDGVHLANLIADAYAAEGKRPPRIPVVDTAEVALMNAMRLNYRFDSDEHTLIIYVAQEFTRLIFMRGNEYQHFAPVIAEGIESVNLQNTIYSRASLEQDNIGIHHLDRIILAGDAQRLGLRDFFKDKFSVSDVSYIKYDGLDTSLFPADTVDELSEYAIPIATAWKVLDSKNPALYPSNMLPPRLLAEQKVLKFAWHGYAALILLFIATLFFAAQIPRQQAKINRLAEEINFKETQALEVAQLEASVAELRNEIRVLESALGLYEELVPGYNRWSRNLTHLSTGVNDLNSLWILDAQSRGDHGRGLEINGYSIYRSRIPRFANLFDDAILQEVLVQEIRGRIVYRFKVIVEDTGVPQ
jgi:Tfp pilus assembly protein PilN